MMVSYPRLQATTSRSPNFLDLLAREVERLRDLGRISPLDYARSRDLLSLMGKTILNIYGRKVNGLQQALAFLLQQSRR